MKIVIEIYGSSKTSLEDIFYEIGYFIQKIGNQINIDKYEVKILEG